MVDVLSLRRPSISPLPPSPADGACRIDVLGPAARFVVRGRPGVAAAAATALGFPLSELACRAAGDGAITGLWLGPDEWLVLAPDSRRETLGRSLEAALAGLPHAVVDVSHRNAGFVVSGPQADFVLRHGCPLDLRPAAFPVGMCTRTLLGRTEVVLWRTGAAAFHVEVWRSFAPYALDFLNEARREFA